MKLGRLAAERKVIVCCGAGGVGKTTTSAALGLAAARGGRRALVLTIDPARRLAQALGIPPTGRSPVQVAPEILAAHDIALPDGGELHAWMLDPLVVLEGVVDRFAPTPADAERIRRTRLYQALSEVITGLQEYTAAEALFSFSEEGRYDLIVLDTPPSRNALDFLDAPRRLVRFLEERTLAVFVPEPGANPLLRAAAKIVRTALTKTFSESFADDLATFLGAFGKLFGKMRVHAVGVRKLLRSDDSAFIVITSPEDEALGEALYFRGRIGELGLLAQGFVLNRSYASQQALKHPATVHARSDDPDAEALASALQKLAPLAEIETARIKLDDALLVRLEEEGRREGGDGALALPYLDSAVEDLAALRILSEEILRAV
ncbi:MAG: ArsA family ATPase [Deltaproteobacteria bacterium]|nr:ArsA family ATPase [Deltaproteobacteria bacterium]